MTRRESGCSEDERVVAMLYRNDCLLRQGSTKFVVDVSEEEEKSGREE